MRDVRKSEVERQKQDGDEVFDLLGKTAADLLGDYETDEERSEDGVAARQERWVSFGKRTRAGGEEEEDLTHIPILSVNHALASTKKSTNAVMV